VGRDSLCPGITWTALVDPEKEGIGLSWQFREVTAFSWWQRLTGGSRSQEDYAKEFLRLQGSQPLFVSFRMEECRLLKTSEKCTVFSLVWQSEVGVAPGPGLELWVYLLFVL